MCFDFDDFGHEFADCYWNYLETLIKFNELDVIERVKDVYQFTFEWLKIS